MASTLTLSDELVAKLQRQAQMHQTPWQEWALLIRAQASERPGDASSCCHPAKQPV